MRANYSDDAVRALVENYAVTAERRDTTPNGLHALVRIADLDRALGQLSLKFWEVVLLHGLLGIPARETGELLHVSHTAVLKRYRQAIEDIHHLMNGGE